MYLGFGAFMLISAYDVMGFGLRELSLALLCTGAGVIVITTIGFCAGSGRRSIAMQFYSGCLLLGAMYQTGFGILSLIRRSKVKNVHEDLSFILCRLKTIWMEHGMISVKV